VLLKLKTQQQIHGFPLNFTIDVKKHENYTSKQTEIAYSTKVNFRALLHDINRKFNRESRVLPLYSTLGEIQNG